MSGIYRGPNSSAIADAINIDGDRGDIRITSSGSEWVVDDDTITFAKMQNLSANVLIGNTATPGNPVEIPCTAAGRALLDDATASDQRTTLGLGTIATQSAATVAITGGSITGITDLAIADGGTGASSASAARTNLGVAIGTDVLAYDANLQGFVNTFTLPTVDATNGFVLQTNGAGTLQLAAPGGVADGDKGDITVSTGGTVWTVDNDAITYAKIQNVSATDKLLGRSTAGAGDIEEIACTAAGRALLDDADATSQRVTLSAAKSGANSDITSITGLTTALSIAQGGTGSTSGNLIAIGATGIGYGTGAGGAVTQATDKGTAVTLNKPTGRITTHNAALAANTTVIFALNNSLIGENDVIIVNTNNSIASTGSYSVRAYIAAGGIAGIHLTNTTAGSLSDAVGINFSIIKGAAA